MFQGTTAADGNHVYLILSCLHFRHVADGGGHDEATRQTPVCLLSCDAQLKCSPCSRRVPVSAGIVREMAHRSDSKLKSISTTRLSPQHHLWYATRGNKTDGAEISSKRAAVSAANPTLMSAVCRAPSLKASHPVTCESFPPLKTDDRIFVL